MESVPFISKNTTKSIKGIALIMMFIHHLFTFPDYWIEGVYYPWLILHSNGFNLSSKLCVSIFCFLTGYFYFFAKKKNIKYSVRKVTDLLCAYWIVFIPLAIIALINGYEYSALEFFNELIAARRETMIFCWYVLFYIGMMFIFPLVAKIQCNKWYIDLIVFIFVIPTIFRCVKPIIQVPVFNELIGYLILYLPVALAGYIITQKDYRIKHFIKE